MTIGDPKIGPQRTWTWKLRAATLRVVAFSKNTYGGGKIALYWGGKKNSIKRTSGIRASRGKTSLQKAGHQQSVLMGTNRNGLGAK